MSQLKFIDREDEIKMLENIYSKQGSSLFIIYGRRRIGKTELINKFIENKGIYFLATTEGDVQNIKSFISLVSEFFDYPLLNMNLTDWNSVFSVLASSNLFRKKINESKIIIAIDEFPYLIEGNKNIPSIFQKIYDTILKYLNIMLILSGSSMSIMENEVLSYRSPLYGRRSGQIELKPLKFKYIKEFLNVNFEYRCNIYFILGGIPEYLLKIEGGVDFWKNIEKNILSRGAFLYQEAEFLLRTEFREPRNYMLILRSIAYSKHTLGEISDYTHMDKSMVSKYLDVMMSMGLIYFEKPFGSDDKYRKKFYWITDNYLKFWFRYILPNNGRIESSHINEALMDIKNNFPTFAGEQFENLMKELILDGILEKSFDNVSRWWGKDKNNKSGKDIKEIDIIAASYVRKEIIFCECKWSNKPVSSKILKELREKSIIIKEKYPDYTFKYAIFSKSGFRGNLNENDAILMDLNDIERSLVK